MNNLTTTLLTSHSRYDIDESVKQGNTVSFDSSIEQRITRYSIPSFTLTITYRGLSNSDYETIRTSFESNYANTFLLDLGEIDLRPDLMTLESAAWVFTDFKFNKLPAGCINGQITILTSVFFNFTEYQDLFTESTSNTLSTSLDTTFKTILTTTSPISVEYGYENNSLRSNIGVSARLNRDKGGLRRKYTLKWLTKEAQFLALLQYYRKKSGIMGEFGMPDFDIDNNVIINSKFQDGSMSYVKRLDGLYETELSIVEVKQ